MPVSVHNVFDFDSVWRVELVTAEGQLEGMPEPYRYWRTVQDGEVLVGFGARVMFCFDERDQGMRNLAVVALTQAGVPGKEVAALFGLSAVYVSRLRSRAADRGSRALVAPRGAPRKLSEVRERHAVGLSLAGVSGAEIARRMGVSEATVSRLLARCQAREALQDELELELEDEVSAGERLECRESLCEEAPVGVEEPVSVEPTAEDAGEESAVAILAEQAPAAYAGERPAAAVQEPVDEGRIARLGEVEVGSRYAGAMLLHPFLDRLGTGQVLGSLAAGEARRYDAPALIVSACFSFALGGLSLEQSKQLQPQDAGALVGLAAFPSLRTLRPGLAALAEACDPLELQRSFATAMLNADERPPELFYVDDHFVTYWGAQPVAKGYNIRRHLAEPGRDDTFVVDDRWRAVCFASGAPRGLSVSLPEVLWQLKEITGGRPVMIGFDRGGSYPKTFQAIAQAGMEWITWRRAPLVQPTTQPRRSWVKVNGKRRTYLLADERIELAGYEHGPIRQLSAYEHDRVVFQVLTSNHALPGAPLVHRLKGRWCIENANKYLEHHQGIHWLCTHEMDHQANTAKVPNPARKTARDQLKTAETALAQAERALGQAAHAKQQEDLSQLTEQVNSTTTELTAARAHLKTIPAKLPASQLDPNATRATPKLARRALQMVICLVSFIAQS